MRTIELSCGTSIADAAGYLVDHAPLRADFNGVPIRARYATTRPRDIVAHYHRAIDHRSIVWRNSPAGKRAEVERLQGIADAQVKVNICLASLLDLDIESPAAVLAWVEDIAGAADRVGVTFDKPSLVAFFVRHGWAAGANCKPNFDEHDARNVAGWIVGQWLAYGYPFVSKFAADWRVKFEAS